MLRDVLTIGMDPWVELSIGDYYACRIQNLGVPAALDYVTDITRAQYFLSLAKGKVPEGEVPMFSRVTRIASQQESRSETIVVLFKTTLPGGYDLRGWEKWHSELKLSLEGLPKHSSINKDVVDAGVWCLIEKYQHCRQNDTITVRWAGVTFDHIVSPAEAKEPGPFRIEVPPSVIKKATQQGVAYVEFKVVDVLFNESGGEYPYSEPYPIHVELDASLYNAPLFRVDGDVLVGDTGAYAPVDFAIHHKSIFDLRPINLPIVRPVPVPRYSITACLSILRDGAPDETVRLPAVTEKNQGGDPLSIPSDVVAKAAGGWIQAWFEVTNNAGLTRRSGSVLVQVTGIPTSMPAPQIRPMEGTLIPYDQDAVVMIPKYQPHNPTVTETLQIRHGETGGGAMLFEQVRLAGPQEGERYLTKDDLKPFEDKGPFSVFYYTDDGVNTRESEVLKAEIGVRVEDLLAPVVKYAEDGNIDPKDVKGTFLLISFPFIGASAGDLLHWSAVGAGTESFYSGTISITKALEGTKLPALEFEIARSVLLENIDGALTFGYSVEKPGSATTPKSYLRSKLLTLSVGTRVVLKLPQILEASKVFQDQLHPKDVPNGATVRMAITPMRADDKVICSWVGKFGISIIDVPVDGAPGKAYVDALIPPEIIALGIREHGNDITVSYRFTRGLRTYTSPPLQIRLMLVTALPVPTLNKVQGLLFPLLGLAVEAKIEVPKWIMAQPGQRMFCVLKGTFANGTPYLETVFNADRVAEEEVLNGASVFASVESLRNLKEDSTLSIEFSVSYAQRDEPDTGVPFGRREYRIQSVPATLPAPAFDNKQGPVVSVVALNYVQGAFVACAFTGMNTGQTIYLDLIQADGAGILIPGLPGVSSGRVDFPLSPRIISQCVGKTITLRYKVVAGAKTIWSEPQTVKVSIIPAENFPQAVINAIPHKGTLNLAVIAGNPLLTLAPWILIFAGQRVFITLRSAGVAQLDVLVGYQVTAMDADKGLASIPVSRAWLEGVAPNAAITVEVAVTLDNSPNREGAAAFKITEYTVLGQLRVVLGHMYLNGVSIKGFPAVRNAVDSIGNTQIRQGTGGSGGGSYSYQSNNPRVASVDATGKVTGNANGSAYITVTDRNSTKVTYFVVVSNVWRYLFNDGRLTGEEGLHWIRSIGGTFMFDAALYDVGRCYVNGYGPQLEARWTSTYCSATHMTFYQNGPGIYCRYKPEPNKVMCLQPVY